MPRLKTTYRIDVRNVDGTWEMLRTGEDHVRMEELYEEFRNGDTDRHYRLVDVIEHVEREGRGRVYL